MSLFHRDLEQRPQLGEATNLEHQVADKFRQSVPFLTPAEASCGGGPGSATMMEGEGGARPKPMDLDHPLEKPGSATMMVGEGGSSPKPIDLDHPLEKPGSATMMVGEGGSSPKPHCLEIPKLVAT